MLAVEELCCHVSLMVYAATAIQPPLLPLMQADALLLTVCDSFQDLSMAVKTIVGPSLGQAGMHDGVPMRRALLRIAFLACM